VINSQYLSHLLLKAVGSTILGAKNLKGGGASARALSLIFAPT